MSAVTFVQPKLRLAQLLKRPGGPPVAEAIAAAQDNLRTLKGHCIAELNKILDDAEAVLARVPTEPQVALPEFYAIAVQGIGLGEVCGAGSVDSALHSLCELLDHFIEQGRCETEALAVHLRACRLLVTSQLPPQGAAAVLEGLSKVRGRFGAVTAD